MPIIIWKMKKLCSFEYLLRAHGTLSYYGQSLQVLAVIGHVTKQYILHSSNTNTNNDVDHTVAGYRIRNIIKTVLFFESFTRANGRVIGGAYAVYAEVLQCKASLTLIQYYQLYTRIHISDE